MIVNTVGAHGKMVAMSRAFGQFFDYGKRKVQGNQKVYGIGNERAVTIYLQRSDI